MFKTTAYFFRLLLSMVLLILPLSSHAEIMQFVAGKDYQVLTTPVLADQATHSSVPVVEFFSYGCPSCYHYDPVIETWLQHKAHYIKFDRVPVVFHADWQALSKVYYTAKKLGIVSKVQAHVFTAVHEQHQDLTDPAVVAALFKQYAGVSSDAVMQAWQGVDQQLQNAQQQAQSYQIYEIPMLTIAGKYLVSPGMVDGDGQRMLQIVDYLAAKAKREASQ